MLGAEAPFWVFVKNGEHLDPNFEKIFWAHLWSHRGYSRIYFKPDFRSLGPLVSILRAFEGQGAGCRSAFYGPLSKMEAFYTPILEKKFWKHLVSWRGYSRDYFNPDFRSLGPLVSILRVFEWRRAGFRSAFLAPSQKRRPFRPQLWKNNSWERLWSRRGYSRDNFKPNFRSLGPLVSILRAFEWLRAGFRCAFFGPLSKMEAF